MNAWKGEEDDVLHLDALLGITEVGRALHVRCKSAKN